MQLHFLCTIWHAMIMIFQQVYKEEHITLMQVFCCPITGVDYATSCLFACSETCAKSRCGGTFYLYNCTLAREVMIGRSFVVIKGV